MDCSMPVFSVHHQLLEFAEAHVHWVGDAIQPSHPLLSPYPPAFNLSQHQGLFQGVGSAHQVANVLKLQFQPARFLCPGDSPGKSTRVGCYFLLQIGNQSWIFIGRTDAEAETPMLWLPDAKNWLIWKDPDAGKDWGQEEKGTTEDEMVGWHHWLDGHEFGSTPGVGDR